MVSGVHRRGVGGRPDFDAGRRCGQRAVAFSGCSVGPRGLLALLALFGLLVLAGCAHGPVAPRPALPAADPDAAVARNQAAARCDLTGDAGDRPGMAPGGPDLFMAPGLVGDPTQPEPASDYRRDLVKARSSAGMVISANPLATQAGCRILAAGGSAVDAAVAVQMVLGLVEPQSSGIGGGTFIMHHEAATGRVTAYDGREAAPASARTNDLRWISDTQRTPPLPSPRASGRSIGVPGTLRVLELAQREHGRLPWSSLMAPAIALASDGFPISGRLHDAIAAARDSLQLDPEAAAYFLADGGVRPRGTLLRNPAYATTLGAVASQGADALYTGGIAAAIVAKVGADRGLDAQGRSVDVTPGRISLADLAGYRAVVREPVCSDYRDVRICGMPPPSSGGIAVTQTLGILANFDLAELRPTDPDAFGGRPIVAAVHLISEAERLAFADRDYYVADPAYVSLPGRSPAALIDPGYLASRAALIRRNASMGTASAGRPASPADQARLAPSSDEGHGTSQVSIIDAAGNAVSMTTSVESSLGAYRFTQGFVLNNELTDFSAQPEIDGLPVANRLEPGKRPRSSMAPTLVYRRAGAGERPELRLVTGSPGGALIIPFVVRTLVGIVDWGLDAQQASALVNFGAMNLPVTLIGGEHPAIDARDGGRHDPLVNGLRALGHKVAVIALPSGVATIVVVRDGERTALEGGVDPRREGLALPSAH